MKTKSHKEQDCDCDFCQIVKKLPDNYLSEKLFEFMSCNGLDPKYIFDWNMPSWCLGEDLKDATVIYFIILPYIAKKYNLDMLEYIDMVPEIKNWILNAPQEDIESIFTENNE